MSVVDAGTPSVVGSEADAGTSADATRVGSVRDMTLKDIISGMKKRRGAKPMPSTVQRAAERRKRRRREALGLPSEETPEGTTLAAPSVESAPPEEQAGKEEEEDPEDDVVAPQVTIDKDGNIVIDQESLVVSAGTAANADVDRAAVTVENHAFSNHITSATYSKRESAQKWEPVETERFYAALRKFGTDFSLMESSFPKRSRRQLKLKFKREEREFPERIEEALNGPPLPLPPVVKKSTPVTEPEKEPKASEPKETNEADKTKVDDSCQEKDSDSDHFDEEATKGEVQEDSDSNDSG